MLEKVNYENDKQENIFMLHIRNFCDKTSIHGLRYVTEKNTHWLQSLLWGFFTILGVIFCYFLMFLIWTRFDTDPTITAVETLNYPVWSVPFPAVTICDTNKVYRPRAENIKNLLLTKGFTEEYITAFFLKVSSLIQQDIKDSNVTYDDIFAALKSEQYTVESMMLEVMKPCSELLEKCSYASGDNTCKQLFKTIKTDHGFCCSFNYHHSNETFDGPELDTENNKFKQSELYSVGAGINTGLTLKIKIDETEYLSPTRTVPSILILVHDGFDYPEIKLLANIVKKGELLQIPFDPALIETTDDVRALDIRKRHCIFNEEGDISIGKYGYENCIIECRMNTILEKCHCMPFYYNVKYYRNKSTLNQCKLSDSSCLRKITETLYTLRSDKTNSRGMTCSCMPSCDINWYTYTSDIGHMVDSDDLKAQDFIMVHVYNSEYSCIKYKQSNTLTWDGLFASFGGVFGLCLGGSIVSLVEVVYHFTIRLYAEWKTAKQPKQSILDRHGKRIWVAYPQVSEKNQKKKKKKQKNKIGDIDIMYNMNDGNKIYGKPRTIDNDIFVITKVKNI